MGVAEWEEWLIKFGVKEDPRIPEECREKITDKIKKAGTAGIVSYAITEGGFWLLSIPLAITAITIKDGQVPDFGTDEGKAAVAAYGFVFINFARAIVPARVALALGLTPWWTRISSPSSAKKMR